ncbi:MAG TPA: DUF6282 family protein [Protaetiibacter sp.]|nr:DUF6282 family protein [Protaetiibacter sp.]
MTDLDNLLDGAVDLHVHPAPSPFPRRLSLPEAVRQAADAGFYAIAIKSHHHSTVTDGLVLKDALGPLRLQLLTGVALNSHVGGLNPHAVELALGMGGRMVWFPTISSAAHIAQHSGGLTPTFPNSTISLRPETPQTILDDDGQVKPVVRDILGIISEADAILVCGHLDAHETDRLIDAARDAGVTRVLVTHPNFVIGADPTRVAAWAEKGVFIEHSICQYDWRARTYKWGLDTLMAYVEAAGAEQTILSSDLGQATNPLPVSGFRQLASELREFGVDDRTIRELIGGSARRLIE